MVLAWPAQAAWLLRGLIRQGLGSDAGQGRVAPRSFRKAGTKAFSAAWEGKEQDRENALLLFLCCNLELNKEATVSPPPGGHPS